MGMAKEIKQKKHKMAIRYRLYQNQREGKTKGKWYARAVALNTIDTDSLAERIQANCTVKKSDCKAVLQELSEVIREELLNGNKVKLDNFGYFSTGLTTKPAASAKTFSAADNVKGIHINFLPLGRIDKNSGAVVRELFAGAKVAELPMNDVGKD